LTPQILDRVIKAYRIGDPDGDYPIFNSTGSKLAPGRWNAETSPVIYAGEHYSTAMLEKLVHGNGHLPPNQHFIEITIPPGVPYEVFPADHHPEWSRADSAVARAYGDTWQKSKRSLVLIVPSFVARIENNILINDEHPDFSKVTWSLAKPVWWDERLFGASRVRLVSLEKAQRGVPRKKRSLATGILMIP
jgi:RES domain-containing protein